jgi:hypothetical protein
MTQARSFAVALALAGLALASPARADEAVARVHLTSTVSASLEHRASSDAAWLLACDPPCDVDLPLGGEYRFSYSGKKGDAFHLRGAPGQTIVLKVEPRSSAANVAGTGLIVLGAGLGLASVAGLIEGISLAATPERCSPDASFCGYGPDLGKLLVVVAGLGVLLSGGIVVGGISLRSESGPSSKQERPHDAFVRQPVWVGPHVAATKDGVSLPLTLSF